MAPEVRIPKPEGLNAEFYAQIADGTLRLQRCSACGRFRHPPRYFCAACGSGEYEWAPASGRGRLYSWTITHAPFDRGWASEIPYATAVVELEEGPRLIGAIGAADLEPGIAVVAWLDAREEGFTFISFQRVP